MAKKFNQPTRMCISCRERNSQDSLIRLQYINASLEAYSGSGRSFYLCKDCLSQEIKAVKSLMRQCKSGDKDKIMNRLKEIITDDRKS